jgi:threonine dehydrogenase-like Zn-dependent dehydrogenase
MAEYVAVPAINILKLPEDLSFEHASLLEPVTVCLHPILRLGNMLGKDVLIMGAGTIGLLALQIFKRMGAKNVIVSDIVDSKLELSLKLGADMAVNVLKETLRSALVKKIDNGEADIVFESSGSNSAKKAAIEAAKGRAMILQVGTSPSDISYEAALYEQITRKELDIRGSWMNYSAPFPGPEWITAVWMLQTGMIRVDDLITHRYPLDETGKAYDMIFGKKEDFIKVIIKP